MYKWILSGVFFLIFIASSFAQRQVNNYFKNSKQIRETYTVTDTISFMKDGAYRSYYPQGVLKSEGQFDKDIRSGIWSFFDSTGNLVERYNYDFKLSIFYHEDESTLRETLQEKNVDISFLSGFDQIPHYVGGQAELLQFLASNIRYPIAALEAKLEGIVIISFHVNTEGHLSDFRIVRSIGAGCEDEALRVLMLMPPWIPAQKNNQTVETIFYLPLSFRISEKNKTWYKN